MASGSFLSGLTVVNQRDGEVMPLGGVVGGAYSNVSSTNLNDDAKPPQRVRMALSQILSFQDIARLEVLKV